MWVLDVARQELPLKAADVQRHPSKDNPLTSIIIVRSKSKRVVVGRRFGASESFRRTACQPERVGTNTPP